MNFGDAFLPQLRAIVRKSRCLQIGGPHPQLGLDGESQRLEARRDVGAPRGASEDVRLRAQQRLRAICIDPHLQEVGFTRSAGRCDLQLCANPVGMSLREGQSRVLRGQRVRTGGQTRDMHFAPETDPRY